MEPDADANRQLEYEREMKFDDPSLQGNKELVLVVEDDPDVRQIALDTLEKFDYRTLDGGDGKAISQLIEYCAEIDLLLSDIVLPDGRNGPDIAARVQKQFATAKVLLMTGYANFGANSNGNNDLAFPIINKPFPTVELARNIQSVMHEDHV